MIRFLSMWAAVGMAAIGMINAAVSVCAEDLGSAIASPSVPDWGEWGQLPVLSRGRIRPLDSVARLWADEITGRERPLISPPGGDSAEAALARRLLFPEGKTRRFEAGEVVFGWLAAPQLWREIPVFRVSHEELRNSLKLPLRDEYGSRYRLTTIADLESNRAYTTWVGGLADRTATGNVRGVTPTVQAQLETLYGHVGMVHQFGIDPAVPLSVADYDPARTYAVYRSHDRFLSQLAEVLSLWRSVVSNPLARQILMVPMADSASETANTDRNKNDETTAWEASARAVMELHRLTMRPEDATRFGMEAVESDRMIAPGDFDTPLAVLENVVRQAAVRLEAARNEYFAEHPVGSAADTGGNVPELNSGTERNRVARPILSDTALAEMRAAAYEFRTLTARIAQTRLALTMTAPGPAIVPALDPYALRIRRSESDTTPVWLDLRTVLAGSDSLLATYPVAERDAMREAWREAVDAYIDDVEPSRRNARLATAIMRLTGAIRTFGEATSRHREKIVAETATEIDSELVAATRYPTRSATQLEYVYNFLRPFMWTWGTALASMILFGVVQMVPMTWAKRLAFFGGCGMLTLSILFCTGGFVLRSIISRRAPVATLFETLVFVGLVSAVIGLGFTLRILFTEGWRVAMSRTRLPWQCNNRNDSNCDEPGSWGYFILRLVLGGIIFWILAIVPYSESGRAVISLTPTGTSVGRLIAWNAGVILLALTVWYVPRLVVAALVSIGSVWREMRRMTWRGMLEATYQRRIAAAVGAIFAFIPTFIAWWFPETFSPGMDRLMPVLGDQFWLATHVLTITASYGAGAIGWGLGNIALVYYLFGTYHGEENESEKFASSLRLHEPTICATLAGSIYFSILIAVGLLTLGTILGALWADVSWGRFWAWDQKEVWSLVTIFVYMVILHGRYTRWLGDFGMAAGAAVGAASILMAWFGVSFLLPGGLHSYGSLDSQQMKTPLLVTVVVLLANLALVLAAGVRLHTESRNRTE